MRFGVTVCERWRIVFLLAGSTLMSDFNPSKLATLVAHAVPADKQREFKQRDYGDINFSGQKAESVVFNGSDFTTATLRKAHFVDCEFEDCTFDGALLVGTRFENCNFLRSSFRFTDADSAQFHGCQLAGVNLLPMKVSEDTVFNTCELRGTKMSRMQLHMMQSYGQISAARRSTMEIVDDFLHLRSLFSGYWNRIHLTALLVFIFPYVFFVIRQWSRLKIWSVLPSGDGEELPMIVALWYYIVSGGTTYSKLDVHWLPTTLFCVALLFNILRAALMLKTKLLEQREAIYEMPVDFELYQSLWLIPFVLYHYLAYVIIFVIAIHAFLFLTQPIPLPNS